MSKYEEYYGEPVFDYKLCGKNLLDNFKIQNDFYKSIFSGYGRLKNIIEDDNKLQKYIQGLWDDGEELCEFCKYNGECNGMTCNGNGPVYPACADLEFDSYIDWDKVYDKVICDKQDDYIDTIRYYVENFKEEKDMNKVLNLWYERQKNKIDERYKLMEVQFYNDKYSVVGSFNELIEKFNNDLDDLYKLDKATEQFVLKENTPNNVIKYCLDLDSLKERFNVEYLIEKNKEIEELGKIKEEVEAQLSLSNDLEYQQEVLIRYDIINKKTKKISE